MLAATWSKKQISFASSNSFSKANWASTRWRETMIALVNVNDTGMQTQYMDGQELVLKSYSETGLRLRNQVNRNTNHHCVSNWELFTRDSHLRTNRQKAVNIKWQLAVTWREKSTNLLWTPWKSLSHNTVYWSAASTRSIFNKTGSCYRGDRMTPVIIFSLCFSIFLTLTNSFIIPHI